MRPHKVAHNLPMLAVRGDMRTLQQARCSSPDLAELLAWQRTQASCYEHLHG
jgi:hypothetical protein